MKTMKMTCAAPRISRPMGPAMISPASAMLWTCGYRSLKVPIMYPVAVAMTPRPYYLVNKKYGDTALHETHDNQEASCNHSYRGKHGWDGEDLCTTMSVAVRCRAMP